jgi:D-amino peptidase
VLLISPYPVAENGDFNQKTSYSIHKYVKIVSRKGQIMKILVSADMEGVSGVTRWEETDPSHKEYVRFRKIMTDEVNSAIAGAAEAGADEFVVVDGHGDGTNILIEDLDTRARLNSGGASPLSMMQGIDKLTTGVFFIGYHARAGSQGAVLAHTWSSGRIANVWLNDILVGEFGLNAALAGHFGVPILMISGDQTACSQAEELLGPIETAIVKMASGYFSAECISPKISCPIICETANRAVHSLIKGVSTKPFIVERPIRVRIEFRQPESADRAARLPWAKRLDEVQICFSVRTMIDAHAGFRAAVKQSYD